MADTPKPKRVRTPHKNVGFMPEAYIEIKEATEQERLRKRMPTYYIGQYLFDAHREHQARIEAENREA